MVNSRIADIKKTFKIDQNNDPRDEVGFFFEETFRISEISSHNDMYKVLTAVWPPSNIKNYWTVTEESEKVYSSLKAFLSVKNGKLNRIFRPRPD